MQLGGRSPLYRGRISGRVIGEVVEIEEETCRKRQAISHGSMLCIIIFSFTFNSYYENNGDNNISLSLQNSLKVFILSF